MRKNYCLTEDEDTSENSSLSFKNRPSCKLALGHVDLSSKQAREHRIILSSYTHTCTIVHSTMTQFSPCSQALENGYKIPILRQL